MFFLGGRRGAQLLVSLFNYPDNFFFTLMKGAVVSTCGGPFDFHFELHFTFTFINNKNS